MINLQLTYGICDDMHDVAKFMGADQMGAQSVYASLRVVSESVTNFEKSLIFGKDLPSDKVCKPCKDKHSTPTGAIC